MMAGMSRIALAASAALALTMAFTAATSAEPDADLRPVSAFSGIADPRARSVALFEEMGRVITHPRCVNCHPRTDRPLQGDLGEPHDPPVTRGLGGMGAAGLACTTCHGPDNVPFANGKGSIPGHPTWHLAPIEMAWEGKSLRAICEQIKDRKRNGGKTLAQIQEHMAHDGLVGWGWHPGKGRQPVPGTQAAFGELTQAWIDTGARCPK